MDNDPFRYEKPGDATITNTPTPLQRGLGFLGALKAKILRRTRDPGVGTGHVARLHQPMPTSSDGLRPKTHRGYTG